MPRFLASDCVQAAIAATAAAQHGVITTNQLLSCGLTSSGITNWVHASRLHRIHRGVYAVGHRGLSIEGDWMAAVLACGEGALLSHRSAAMLHRMLERSRAPVHVTVPGHAGRSRRKGIVVHRSVTLGPDDSALIEEIPATAPARTLRDLRASRDHAEYRRALRQAEFRGLPAGGVPEADGSRSGLESDFLAFCRHHALPIPEVNVSIGPYTADFLWPHERVIVETDSYRTHGGPVAFEEDRARDLWLRAQGYTPVRVTDVRLKSASRRLAAELRAILKRSREQRAHSDGGNWVV